MSDIDLNVDGRTVDDPARPSRDFVPATVAARAAGTLIILTALLVASHNAGTVGVLGGIVLAVIVLITHHFGGMSLAGLRDSMKSGGAWRRGFGRLSSQSRGSNDEICHSRSR